MIISEKLAEKKYAKSVKFGENGIGISVEGLAMSSENFINKDFCGNVYEISQLNRKSKSALAIMYDVIRSHIIRDADGKINFKYFELPLVISNNFSAKDFIELWGNVAEEIFFTFGIKLAWEYVENTADHCKQFLEDKEIYQTVQIFECSQELFYCLYSLSLDLIEDPQKEKPFTTQILFSDKKLTPPESRRVRNGKAEKAKTVDNKEKKEQEQKTAEKTSKELEEKTAEVEKLKKEVEKKDKQLNKKQIDKFNDEALFSIANCVEFLVKKHCPVPAEFDFSTFEADLFKVISAHWDLKILDK